PRIWHQRHPPEDRPRGASRRLHEGDDRALQARALLRAPRSALHREGPYCHRPGPLALLEPAPPEAPQGRVDLARAGDRLVPPADERYSRSPTPARVPQAALAIPQGPPQPRPPAVLRDPPGPALPRLHHGHADVLGPHAGFQLVLSRHIAPGRITF